ncbi:MAG TPA: hypothetical protein VFX59_18470, partial [Polyangiales bacterium]|nr:hypothetical protein [Polyangiales bacterium]
MSRAVAALLLIGAGVLVCWAYWDQHWPATYTAGKRAHHDGVYYYVYLRSLGFDGDIDFANDYQLLENPWQSPVNARTGRFENMFGIGTALAWSPMLAIARLVYPSQNGASEDFQWLVYFASALYGFAATVLMYLTA